MKSFWTRLGSCFFTRGMSISCTSACMRSLHFFSSVSNSSCWVLITMASMRLRLVVVGVFDRHLAFGIGAQVFHLFAFLADARPVRAAAGGPDRAPAACNCPFRWWRSRTSCPGRRRPARLVFADSTPWAMSALCSWMALRMPQLFASNLYSALGIADALDHVAGGLLHVDVGSGTSLHRRPPPGRWSPAFRRRPWSWGPGARNSSRMASLIWSATLSGCPSETDSEVKR